jgi:hypothetical protein
MGCPPKNSQRATATEVLRGLRSYPPEAPSSVPASQFALRPSLLPRRVRSQALAREISKTPAKTNETASHCQARPTWTSL